jgi:ribosomal protein S18 acetylase RimI-like enzyme
MDAWERAIAFMRTVDERAAESVVPFRWGRALINRRLDRVHDLNFLIADRVGEAGASELDAEAERIQGDAGLAHRRVNVDNRPAVERLSPAFGQLGYTPERFVIMAHRGRPDREVDIGAVREVGWEQMRPARELEIASQPWGADPRVVQQLLAKHQLTAQGIRTRYFAALLDGAVVSSCELRSEGDTAQVETVETLPEFRQRGLSRLVVSAALRAAEGHAFVFLVTDAEGWPQNYYRRLGFEPVGIESRFLRIIDT